MVYDACAQHSDAAKRYGVIDLCISCMFCCFATIISFSFLRNYFGIFLISAYLSVRDEE